MLGQYDSQVASGQRRVLLVWTRLIMPDGSSITLDRMEGIDPGGYSGLEDKVDSHWGKVFAGAALSTLLGVNSQLVGNRLHLGGVTSPPRSVRPNGSYRRRDRTCFFRAQRGQGMRASSLLPVDVVVDAADNSTALQVLYEITLAE
jgi:type IV secretory pathway VirB10-like protein